MKRVHFRSRLASRKTVSFLPPQKWPKQQPLGPIFVSNLWFLFLAFGELKEAQAEELQGVTGPVVQANMLS